ncbi:hypothetical protein F52700_11752 [Fusarium sp. NRRL 52700]|nr:hypothetical protein F52700_11752 [Fusarium sp. NRRL 52700]
MKWLLLSDLHFKHRDLDRIRQTAQWIIAQAERNQVKRVVICGDLLTSQTKQSTHVLSTCYRFVSVLSDVVPRIHIVLGNHDLAYRRDYQTTALEALNIKRLAPFVSVHSAVSHQEWDGRSISLLPFREDQSELIDAVAGLSPEKASKTVAFAHLAIHKAIIQRYVVDSGIHSPRQTSPITYRGWTGPGSFASLARTFTGHFHSHQTITQTQLDNTKGDLRGSITYLGSPLQLNWADLHDDKRGVVLLDPDTLEHKLLTNPYAIGYTTANLQQVLENQVNENAVKDKHVMLTGNLTLQKYVLARDKLLRLGARSIRDWTSIKFASHTKRISSVVLETSVSATDIAAQPLQEGHTDKPLPEEAKAASSDSGPTAEPQAEELDFSVEVRDYVESLELDKFLTARKDELVRVGQRMMLVSCKISDQDRETSMNYKDFLDKSPQAIGMETPDTLVTSSTHVFVAQPFRLIITNFLGIQKTISIDFQHNVRRGLTFLVGDNGSGKSTIVEAMVWCQFGHCLRGGFANDVVNDEVGKNCSVTLEFTNGYSITRYRKHKIHKNSLTVSLHGNPQPQLATQTALVELLGIDYETYTRTVVLSHESASNFLNSKQTQRHDLIEGLLGLSSLNQCSQISKLLIKDIDASMTGLNTELDTLARTINHDEERLQDLRKKQKMFESEVAHAFESLNTALRDRESNKTQPYQPYAGFQDKTSMLQTKISNEEDNLLRLRTSYRQIWEQYQDDRQTQLDQPQYQLGQRLEAMASARPKGVQKIFLGIKILSLRFQLVVRSVFQRIFGFPKDGIREKSVTRIKNQENAVYTLRQGIEKSVLRLEALRDQEIIALKALKDRETARLEYVKATNNWMERNMRAQRACETLQQKVTIKKHEAATYKQLVEDKQSSLAVMRSELDVLNSKLEELASDRELFNFWVLALAKRTRQASSSSPSLQTKDTTNFREHILANSLAELNDLIIQAFTVLYDDTRHVNMAKGMLRSLFDSDSANMPLRSVLDPTLAVDSSIAYNKRSSGERKRVDLALFFALLQLARARSAHRAQYVLIDEVFDNLDQAGQVAVVRWCEFMSQAVAGWIIVITHSSFLIEQNLAEETSKGLVVRAKMGEGGTELFVDGKKIEGTENP